MTPDSPSAGSGTFSVLLVEDSVVVRNRIAALLKDSVSIAIAGEAGSVAEAIRLYDLVLPDAVVLDMSLSDGSGLDVLAHIKRLPRHCATVVLTEFDIPEFRRACQDMKADYFFGKSGEFERAVEVLGAMAAGAERGRQSEGCFSEGQGREK